MKPMSLEQARRLEQMIVQAGGPRDPNLRPRFAEAQAWLDMAERQQELGAGPVVVIGWVAALLVMAAGGLFGVGIAKNWETVVETGEFWAQALNLLSKVVVYGSVFAVGLGIYRYAVQGRSFPRLFDGGGDSPVVP